MRSRHISGANYQPDFTVVFEVARKRRGTEWDRDQKLIDYFTRLGFRTVDFDYRYPILQSYDGDASFPADLMIRLPANRFIVSAPEMRTILRSIYFKHYLRWDRPFLDPERFGERERLINDLYTKQVATIGDKDSFGTFGGRRGGTALKAFTALQPKIRALADRVFGPKLLRIVAVMALVLVTQRLLGSPWALLIFVPAVAIIYCLAEDTNASRQLVRTIMTHFRIGFPPSSRGLPRA